MQQQQQVFEAAVKQQISQIETWLQQRNHNTQPIKPTTFLSQNSAEAWDSQASFAPGFFEAEKTFLGSPRETGAGGEDVSYQQQENTFQPTVDNRPQLLQ